VPAFCDAVQANPRARFYAALAELTRSLVSVEAQAFDLMV
jgi:TorA maturation chaperone TorD